MVRIVNYAERHNALGEAFYALILQGGIEMVKSNTSGKFYATAKQASVTSTFDEETCRRLIGSELEGSIKKVACEPHQYAVPETGEVITISSRWEYVKEGETLEENVFHGEVAGMPDKREAFQL
jgi:hypothetical protein